MAGDARKVLVLSPVPAEMALALLKARVTEEEARGVRLESYSGSSREDLKKAVSEADVIIGDYTNNIALDAEVMRSAKRCTFIQQPSTGFQHIDVDEAARQGIPVANAAGGNTAAVAEHAMMLILACLKKLLLAAEKTRRCQWAQDEMSLYGVFELEGKTLGIIGMGRIGRELARRARPFGPRMIYHDVVRLTPEEEEKLGTAYRDLDGLVQESDVITIHIPLTPQTTRMIDAQRLATMKRSAVVINVSRGEIIDEQALAQALREGRIGGAGLDVFSEEPICPENPLLDAPNAILTPHIAGATNESRARIIDITIDNVARVLRGETPVNVVNGVVPGTRRPAG
ncbi:MAG: hydroxyacid dehydrogenase [Chloroflexi bacterium]|nr:hydroxyacid dehydrogenase [Chloroflexota bacterium]